MKDNIPRNRVLFLDYDGVVNTPMWNETGTKCRFNFPKDGKVNNFQAVQWISEFCQKFHFQIVVTSTWRLDSNWRECLINGGLREGITILDRTDDLWGSNEKYGRGEEIKKWLSEHPEIKYYIIVDDDISDMLEEQAPFIINTDMEIGFTIHDMKKAERIFIKERSKRGK